MLNEKKEDRPVKVIREGGERHILQPQTIQTVDYTKPPTQICIIFLSMTLVCSFLFIHIVASFPGPRTGTPSSMSSGLNSHALSPFINGN